MRRAWLASACAVSLLSVGACEGPDALLPAASMAKAPDDAVGARAADDEGERLRVPPETIHRARREALGLSRMPESLRGGELASRRAAPQPTYRALRAAPDEHARRPMHVSGRVQLARPAGRQLWILALMTRRDGGRLLDPLYVLSVVDPGLPADGGADAWVDGWVVGERTIGRHALPLIVAYSVELRSGVPPSTDADPAPRAGSGPAGDEAQRE